MRSAVRQSTGASGSRTSPVICDDRARVLEPSRRRRIRVRLPRMLVHTLARARRRERLPCFLRRQQELVALDRALPLRDAEPFERREDDRIGQGLDDVLVRAHLHRELHELGLARAEVARMREVTEHEVMHFVQEDPARVLGVLAEVVRVDVQEEAPFVQREREGLGRRIIHRCDAREHRCVIWIAAEEVGIADESIDERASVLHRLSPA
jgi:hypothetical protein